MLVAEGAIDLAIDAIGLAPYDLAAVMVVVEEAGGTFTDRHGERTYLNDSAVSSNGLLHHHIEVARRLNHDRRRRFGPPAPDSAPASRIAALSPAATSINSVGTAVSDHVALGR